MSRDRMLLACALLLACVTARAGADLPAPQEARVPSDPGVVLAATLRLPAGPGPHPVVLLLSGGGASRRGVFTVLADRLLALGIATFEYDKRGVGDSTGTFVDAIPLMERDAAAAVAYLRTRRDIDPRRIALAGLSQGGVVAPALAARDPAIAAVVTLAAPIGARGAPFMLGLRSRLAAQGVAPVAIGHVAEAVRQWMEARLADAAPAEVARLRAGAVTAFAATGATPAQAEGMVAVLDTPTLLSMYDSGTAGYFQRIRAPVLALFGTGDEVLAPGTVAAAKAALDGHPSATIVEIPGVNHGFQEPGAAGTGLPAVSAPALLRLVPAWLAERLARPR